MYYIEKLATKKTPAGAAKKKSKSDTDGIDPDVISPGK